MSKTIKLSDLKQHPENPRDGWTVEKLTKLAESIKKFPKAMTVVGFKVDMKTGIIWGGNQRHEALINDGRKTIPANWVQDVSHFTEEEKKRLMILDNASWGTWNAEKLASEYWETVKFEEYTGEEWTGNEDTEPLKKPDFNIQGEQDGNGDAYDFQGDDEDLHGESVKMVSIFVQYKDLEQFNARWQQLSEVYETEGITTTILEALRRESENHSA